MDRDPRLNAQLAPLERALMSAVHEDVSARLEDAESRAAAIVRQSEDRAHERLERARAEGKSVAEREAARRLMQARRRTRGLVLRAQRAAYDRLLAGADAVARALPGEPVYADLERRLVEAAKATLGAEVEIVRNPDDVGGVRARAGSRSLDLTLPHLARRCVEHLGEKVTGLWS